MKPILVLIFTIFSFTNLYATTFSEVKVFTISSSINPSTLDYLKHGLIDIKRPEETLVIIKINTPGGLVTTTKDIITEFGKYPSPIVIWVTPEGASATSAGAIIASSAHFVFMSKGTNIGAATPIEMSGDIKGDGRNKAVNDLVALVESLSKARGHNPEYFGQMISKAKSFGVDEAIKGQVANGVANSLEDIFKQLQNKKTTVLGREVTIDLSNRPQVEDVKMTTGQTLLDIVANPMASYVLFIAGAILIYLELQAPGGFIAGSIGALLLIFSGLGFQLVPINLGGIGLMAVSFIFFILEIYVTSYGLLTIAGLISLLFGSLLLYKHDNLLLDFNPNIVYSTVASVSFVVVFFAWYIWKDHNKRQRHNFFGPVGEKGIVLKFIEETQEGFFYQVHVYGEIWKAKSKEPLQDGEKIKVTHLDNDHLIATIQKEL